MIKPKRSMIHPEEWDWEKEIGAIKESEEFVYIEAGRLLGLAVCYEGLLKKYEELTSLIEQLKNK